MEKIDGSYVEFFENGDRMVEGNYKNGVPNGIWTYYDETGNIVKIETYNAGVAEKV